MNNSDGMKQKTLTKKQLWFSNFKPIENPRLRLICFPYAGSGPVVFHKWVNYLPQDIEVWGVRLPGRDVRYREPAFTSLSPLVSTLADEISPFMDVPFIIFGHSMGALISFELVHSWRETGGPQPVHVVLSGHRAPHRPPLNPPVHNSDKHTFLNRIKNLGGTPEKFFSMNDLVDLMMPAMRADFSVWETYEYQEKIPLELPITVFGGRNDSEATESDFVAWQDYTKSDFNLHIFDGGHFYFQDDLTPLMDVITKIINENQTGFE
jgi:medium-chain acyl-[acyl-carrier-protein] hydrolase